MIAIPSQMVKPLPPARPDLIDHTAIVHGKMTPRGLVVQYTVITPGCEAATVEMDPVTYYEALKLEAEIFIKRARMIEADHAAACLRGAA
jgi:hypothetical protein